MPNIGFFSDLTLLKRDELAAHLVGMPWVHAKIFMQVARQERCVISSRQLGRVCTFLIRDGYDTKGFRMKSKSCDFGPMAGFICVDERLHKKGAAYNPTQKADVEHALHGDDWDETGAWKASTEQVCITQDRLQELTTWHDPGNEGARIEPRTFTGNINARWGVVSHPVKLIYVLKKEERFSQHVWALYLTNAPLDTKPALSRTPWPSIETELKLKPLLALVNPYPAYPRGHYKNCCTGDYDLFGVWPLKQGAPVRNAGQAKRYEPMGEDRRIAGMSGSSNPKVRNAQTVAWEDKRLGNISNRVHTVAQVINSYMYSEFSGGKGAVRDVIHHSDEAGRPFISGIDDHIIAFVPGPAGQNYIVGVESPGGHPIPAQWAAFIRICDACNYQVILNTHWKSQLNSWGVGDIGTIGDGRGWRPAQNDPVRSK